MSFDGVQCAALAAPEAPPGPGDWHAAARGKARHGTARQGGVRAARMAIKAHVSQRQRHYGIHVLTCPLHYHTHLRPSPRPASAPLAATRPCHAPTPHTQARGARTCAASPSRAGHQALAVSLACLPTPASLTLPSGHSEYHYLRLRDH